MGMSMDDTVDTAVAAARAKHPDGEWERLSPSERTEAIYREMRRIDAERAQAGSPVLPRVNGSTEPRDSLADKRQDR